MHMAAPIAEGADLEFQAAIFCQTAAQKGWNLTIMGHMCDGHNPANAANKPKIEVVSGMSMIHKN